MVDAPSEIPSTLPSAYRAWRSTDLGRITDKLEEELILELIRPVQKQRILDVGCGDGTLAVLLTQRGADVTGIDADLRMLAAARERASKFSKCIGCFCRSGCPSTAVRGRGL